MMDVAMVAKYVQDEATCPICLEYFKEPVILDCGHNFCNVCITQCWEGSQSNVTCPQCRQSFATVNLKPNRLLGNILGLIKQFQLRDVVIAKPGNLCELHQKPLKLFCKDDQVPMCSVCEKSRIHGAHLVASMEEAAREYKAKIRVLLEAKKRKLAEIKNCFSDATEQKHNVEKLVKNGARKITLEYKQLCQSVKGLQDNLLDLVESLNKHLYDKQIKLREESSTVEKLIGEMEKKCEQPACEFLQDIKQTLNKYEAGVPKPPEYLSSELKEQFWDLSLRSLLLEDTLRKCTETLTLTPKVERANVTLDPATAYSKLILYENQKTVKYWPSLSHLVASSQGFDSVPCVLGCEGFASGKHYWEVEITGEGGNWAVGVAKESVKRKGVIPICPEEGIWALQQENCLGLFPKAVLQIRVYLDYEGERVAFFGAGYSKLIATFAPAAFAGERIFPFFMLVKMGAQAKLYP